MESRRLQRVADLLLHEIARILQKDVKDPRVGFVTLTGVDITADLRIARVFYTVFGGPRERTQTARGLESARPYIRREVGQRLRLKAVPEIHFHYDESIDKGFRLHEILEDMQHDSQEPDC